VAESKKWSRSRLHRWMGRKWMTVGENSNSCRDSVMILLTLYYMRNIRQFFEIRQKVLLTAECWTVVRYQICPAFRIRNVRQIQRSSAGTHGSLLERWDSSEIKDGSTHCPEPGGYVLWERGLTISGNKDWYYAPFLERKWSNEQKGSKEYNGW
jgi:hypothetical protein